MLKTDPMPRAAAALLRAPPSPPDNDRAGQQTTQWNDTPDAMCHWPAWRPQTQHWRGFPLTTASREADHSQTTTPATH